MTRRSSKTTFADVGDVTELQETIRRLIDHVGCLVDAVDVLTDQLKWRNNNDGNAEIPVIPRLELTSMPRNPAARTFAINCAPQKTIDRLRDEISQPPANSASKKTQGALRHRPPVLNSRSSTDWRRFFILLPRFLPSRRFAMKVNLRDGRCRSCNGALVITDADDATMTVECTAAECGDSYQVEPDAFGDGCMIYYLEFMTQRMEAGDAE